MDQEHWYQENDLSWKGLSRQIKSQSESDMVVLVLMRKWIGDCTQKVKFHVIHKKKMEKILLILALSWTNAVPIQYTYQDLFNRPLSGESKVVRQS